MLGHQPGIGSATRPSQTHGEQKRRAEGKNCGDERGSHGADDDGAYKSDGLGRIETDVSASEAAPHPADHRQMSEQDEDKTEA